MTAVVALRLRRRAARVLSAAVVILGAAWASPLGWAAKPAPELQPSSSSASSAALAPDSQRRNYAFEGGWWWTGDGFERRTFYCEDGILTRRRPARIERVFDFGDRHVAPPFADAHSHTLQSRETADLMHRRYLEQGIFYVAIANNVGETAMPVREWLAAPQRVDAIFSNGGITSSGGHPIGLWERTILPRAFPGHSAEWLRGRAFFIVDSAEDLARVWPGVLEGRPDFIKTFLLYSEEHQRRRSDGSRHPARGLDPAVLPPLVERAHGAGLRIAAHVETAQDFRLAIRSGVDQVMHLPGYQVPPSRRIEEFRLTPRDAQEASAAGVVVVTTTVLANRHLGDLDHWRLVRENQAHNLTLLRDAGVTLAVGSDANELTSRDELMSLRALGIFDDRALLELWTSTAVAIFPGRRIGRLEDGYEASFLVLDGDPLEDFSNVQRISFRFKEGYVIDL
jgi:imidazolonepropionase-like amidohydrolase